MLRPQVCTWFELITSREQLTAVLQALAQGGAVELQAHERQAKPLVIAGVERALERFHELARSCQAHWPPPRRQGHARIEDPAATLAARLAQLEAWQAQAEPLLAEQERRTAEAQELADLARLLQTAGAGLPAPGLLASAGRFLVAAHIYVVPAHSPASDLPVEVLQLAVPGGALGGFVIAVGRGELLDTLDSQFEARKARRIRWPADLQGSAEEAAAELQRRRAALEEHRAELVARLDALAAQHELPAALADIDIVAWLIRHGSELAASERLVWVTGWTTCADERAFSAPLEQQGLHCVLRFATPTSGIEAPSVLANPRWVRPFEAFARMLGQPGAEEADPSPLVALIAPLLFGFMFGDVGQGAVLMAAGWLLHKRLPMLLVLVPGGAMAMLFGLAFGTVFAREDLIPPLWMHPLSHPVELLAVAVGLGAAILLGGLLLQAVQAFWRHGLPHWLAREAGLVLAYTGLLAVALDTRTLWLVPLGALWVALGAVLTAEQGRGAAGVGALAQFVEHALQLAVNTVSFARVGAFALAHAGLSVAVTGMAQASGGIGYWVVLLLGNLLILVLEGLVVGIQTTRLLLFEFFVRFLSGTGRAFRPLPPPLPALPPVGSSP